MFFSGPRMRKITQVKHYVSFVEDQYDYSHINFGQLCELRKRFKKKKGHLIVLITQSRRGLIMTSKLRRTGGLTCNQKVASSECRGVPEQDP